jgi:hypothetical protein
MVEDITDQSDAPRKQEAVTGSNTNSVNAAMLKIMVNSSAAQQYGNYRPEKISQGSQKTINRMVELLAKNNSYG